VRARILPGARPFPLRAAPISPPAAGAGDAARVQGGRRFGATTAPAHRISWITGAQRRRPRMGWDTANGIPAGHWSSVFFDLVADAICKETPLCRLKTWKPAISHYFVAADLKPLNSMRIVHGRLTNRRTWGDASGCLSAFARLPRPWPTTDRLRVRRRPLGH
jgi:hypothetical protein